MPEDISCPVSHIKVNENRVRMTALFVFLASLSYLIFPYWPIPAVLLVDFFLRGFGLGRYSPFYAVSGGIVSRLRIGSKPIDQAPKVFAARLGFVFSGLLLATSLWRHDEAAYVFAAVLVLFSFLESAIGFCAGCYVYLMTKMLFPGVFRFLVVLFFLFPGSLSAQQGAHGSTAYFSIESYYKVKWGYADEFIRLWKTNHYVLLKKAQEHGDVISIKAETPRFHSGEDTRWDFRVTVTFKNVEAAFDEALLDPYKKQLFPDLDALGRSEQHRFELLLAHWDIETAELAL